MNIVGLDLNARSLSSLPPEDETGWRLSVSVHKCLCDASREDASALSK